MRRRLAAIFLLFPVLASAQQWLAVERADRPITVAASGIVTSADALKFGPPPNRRWRISITELVQEGARIKEGDVLARFDGSVTDDRIRTLDADLNARRSELESLVETQAREVEDGKVRLAAARSAAEKAARKAAADAELFASLEYRKLLEERDRTQDAWEREQARTVLVERVRVSKMAELESEIRRLESELAAAQKELEGFVIRAPRDGLAIIGVDESGKKLDTGDQANPGMVVVELASPDDLVIQAEVPEYAANALAVGQPARITIDAAGGSELDGDVIEVASIVRRQSQYSQAMVRDVIISLPESAIAGLRPGMSAKLSIVVDTQRDVLAVPDEALVYRGGLPGVQVRGDGWREVRLGRSSAGMHIVEDGLAPGDEVAL